MSKDIVVIIGAGGIGMAIARRQGFGKTILLADFNEQTMQNAANQLSDAGYHVKIHAVDVASRLSVESLAAYAASLGNVMQVVNTAGLSPNMAPVDKVLEVDLYGAAVVFEEFEKVIAPGGAGLVISSMAGHMMPALTPEQDYALAYARDENGKPGPIPVSEPRALSVPEIKAVVQDYVQAAKNAIRAGFDGVEIHAANGYLLEQFINGGLNIREDEYGGADPENRLRFVLEVTDAISAAIGAGKTGIRLAPFGRLFDMHAFEGEEETWLLLADKLSARSLSYVHLSDQQTLGEQAIPAGFIEKFRAAYSGPLIIAGGFDKQRAEAYIQEGKADLIGFGRPYIVNPDLVERMVNNWSLNDVNRATMYGGDEKGYTDYPFWSDSRNN